MIDYLKYRFELSRLLRERRSITKRYAPLIKSAHPDERDEILHDQHTDISEIEDLVHRLETDKLWDEAKALMVPIPKHDDDGMWEESEMFGWSHLSVKGVNKLRSDIREERKARTEQWLLWLAPITGIIGALTGLAAVVLNK